MPRYTKTALGSGFNKSLFDQNFDDLATAIDSLLARDGSGTNTMEDSLDMDSQRIINVPLLPTSNADVASKKYVDDTVGGSSSAQWGGIVGTLSDQTDLASALALKAPLASPVFTGTFTSPGISDGATGGIELTITDTSVIAEGKVTFEDGGLTVGSQFYASKTDATTPKIQFDSNDKIEYERGNNKYIFYAAGADQLNFDGSDMVIPTNSLDISLGDLTVTGGSIQVGGEDDKGAGSINATALYVGGVAVSSGTGDVVGPASATSGGNVALFDDTTGKLLRDSTRILGTAGSEATGTSGNTIPFLDGTNTWTNAQTIGTMTIAGGSITDSSAAISFGDENLVTTGTLGAGVATLATGSTIGNLTLADGSITDSGGSISFGDENLLTTGTFGAGVTTVTGFTSTGIDDNATSNAITISSSEDVAIAVGSLVVGDSTTGAKFGVSNGFFGLKYNGANVYPGSDDGTSANPAFMMGTNFTDGGGELNLWNTGVAAAGGFVFYKKTGASSKITLVEMLGNGNVSIPSGDLDITTGDLDVTAGRVATGGLSPTGIAGSINATALFVSGVPVSSGSGDVVGPASSTDGQIAIFDGATGKLLKDSFGVPGTAALINTGTSGTTIPLLDGVNIWSGATNTFSNDVVVSGTLTNSAITANTSKVTNATHTGDVTGSVALTIASSGITGKTAVTAVGGDFVLLSDTSDSGNLKKALVSDIAGATAWGSITGTLSAQTDLQAALDLKANLAAPFFTGDVHVGGGSGTLVLDAISAPVGGWATFNGGTGGYDNQSFFSSLNDMVLSTSSINNNTLFIRNDSTGAYSVDVEGDLDIGKGVVVGSPTGSNKGIGTVNAINIYKQGTEVPAIGTEQTWSAKQSFISSLAGAAATAGGTSAAIRANFSAGTSGLMEAITANITRTSGTNATVGLQCSATSNLSAARVFGAAFEAFSIGATNNSALAGMESAVISQSETNNSSLKYGMWSVFKDRLDGAVTVGTVSPNQFNTNSHGLRISSGGARTTPVAGQGRSDAGEFCGWVKGISFSNDALDESIDGKPTAIDFAEIGASTDPNSIASDMFMFAFNTNQFTVVNGLNHIKVQARAPTDTEGGIYTGSTYFMPLMLANRSIAELDSSGAFLIPSPKSGWTAATGTADRTTFVTSTVTLEELAQRFKALEDDLLSHNLIT